MVSKKKRTVALFLYAAVLFPIVLLLLSGCRPEDTPVPSPTRPATLAPTPTSPLPDLLITDIALEMDPEDICDNRADTLRIRIQIKNQGDADAEPFIVEVNDVRQEVEAGLGRGQEITLWFSGYKNEIDVRADANLQVAESDESNNQTSRRIAIPILPPFCLQTPTPHIALAYQGPLVTLEGHSAKVWSIAFSPDGNLIASGSVDNTLRLWRVYEGTLLRTMSGHPFPILALDFSPNGALLATGSTDGLIRLWQVSIGRLQQTLEGHAGWVVSLDFSPDGRFLVSCAEDFTVRVWRVGDGMLVQTIDEGMAFVTDVAFSPDGQTLGWIEADGTLRLRSTTGSWLHILRETSQAGTSVAFSPDGEWLASGYADGTIRIWRVEDGELLQTLKNHTDAVSGLAFSPDGKWMVSSSWDHTLNLWQLEGSTFGTLPELIFSGHDGPVNSVSFSPKGDLIASGSDDSTVRLWTLPEE